MTLEHDWGVPGLEVSGDTERGNEQPFCCKQLLTLSHNLGSAPLKVGLVEAVVPVVGGELLTMVEVVVMVEVQLPEEWGRGWWPALPDT